jgi:site-specific recombinase XerD
MLAHGASRRILRPHGEQSKRGALHSDIQTTTIYTEMTQNELQKVVKLFDDGE